MVHTLRMMFDMSDIPSAFHLPLSPLPIYRISVRITFDFLQSEMYELIINTTLHINVITRA